MLSEIVSCRQAILKAESLLLLSVKLLKVEKEKEASSNSVNIF